MVKPGILEKGGAVVDFSEFNSLEDYDNRKNQCSNEISSAIYTCEEGYFFSPRAEESQTYESYISWTEDVTQNHKHTCLIHSHEEPQITHKHIGETFICGESTHNTDSLISQRYGRTGKGFAVHSLAESEAHGQPSENFNSHRHGKSHTHGQPSKSFNSHRHGESHTHGQPSESFNSHRHGESHTHGQPSESFNSHRHGESHTHGQPSESFNSHRHGESHTHGQPSESFNSHRHGESHTYGQPSESFNSHNQSESQTHELLNKSFTSPRQGESRSPESVQESFVNQSLEGAYINKSTRTSVITVSPGTELHSHNTKGTQISESAVKKTEESAKEQHIEAMFGQSTEDDTIKFIIKDCGEEHISLQRDPDAYESDGETCADDFTETNFLRIIKVEETDEDYFTESEVKQSMTGELVASPDRNDKGSAELQEEGVYPLALLTTDSQFAFIGEGRFIVQPCEETSHVDSSVLQFAEEDQYCATIMNKDLETLDELRKNDPARPKRTYSCSMCCKSFLYKLNLEVHERLHAHQASFICLRCDKTFRRKQNLLQHQKKHHPKEDALQYDLLTSLEHNDSAEVPLSHHEGLRQFECTECGRRFNQRIGLIRHQKTHRQDKLPSKYVAPPPKKVYRLPCTQAASTGKKGQEPTATEDAYSQLHRHLQLSTAFLQDLITSTGSFQYD